MNVDELRAALDAGSPLLVLDVREPYEVASEPYPFDVLHVPLKTLPARVGELPGDRTVVCACRTGARSAMAVQFLRAHGFALAVNLEGGIVAWLRRFGRPAPGP